jgi:hypothetical protein
LIGDSPDSRFSLPRGQIVSIFRIRHGFNRAADGTVGGANRGREIGEAIGTTADGRSFAGALGSAVGAGIGALTGLNKRESKLRVLIYSK